MIDFQNLRPINETPVDVDYNNMDEEGGIRLTTKGSKESIEKLGIRLEEGQLAWISDGELDYLAVIIQRRDIWVAVTINGTRSEIKILN